MSVSTFSLSNRIRECAKIVGGGNELSRRTGIKRRTLEDYMTAKSEPKARALASIAIASEVSLDWLILGEGKEQKPEALPSVNNDFLSHIVSLVLERNEGISMQEALLCAEIYTSSSKELSSVLNGAK